MDGGVVLLGERQSQWLAEGAASASSSESSTASPTSPTPVETRGTIGTPSGRSRRTWVYVGIAIVVVLVVVVSAVGLTMWGPSKGASGSRTVIEPAGTLDVLVADQYDAVVIAQHSASTVQGTITNIGGAQVYVMTPGEYFVLVNTYNITGYEWTSGPIPSDTYYNLAVTIPVGSWDLVFASSVPGTNVTIGFYSDLVAITS
jgi:hypothetical protein